MYMTNTNTIAPEVATAIKALTRKHPLNQGDLTYFESMQIFAQSLIDGSVTSVADVSYHDLMVAVGYILDEMIGEITR